MNLKENFLLICRIKITGKIYNNPLEKLYEFNSYFLRI